jgi:hypothetical protein
LYSIRRSRGSSHTILRSHSRTGCKYNMFLTSEPFLASESFY